jgi:hypothetical protein
MTLKRGKVAAIPKRKFHFVPSTHRSPDHLWCELELPGRATIFTKLSHSKDELRGPLIGMMARELEVRPYFFVGMIQRSNSEADYRRSLGFVP